MKMNKIKAMLQRALMSFNEVSTDKGLLAWDGESELPEVGVEVNGIDEEGNEIALEDGEYTLENGTVIVVKEGKVEEVRIQEPEVEEETEEASEETVEVAEEEHLEDEGEIIEPEVPVEEVAEPLPVEPSLEDRIAALEATVVMLVDRIAALEAAPAAEPATEQFKSANYKETGDKKLDRLNRILNA